MAATPKQPLATAESIFLYAEAAEKLIEQAKRAAPHDAQTHVTDAAGFAPMVTLDAFAQELYLKCLQAIDYGKANRGHDCKKLFSELTPGTQRAVKQMYSAELATSPIAKQYAKNFPRDPMTLDKCLDLSSKVFEKVRYLYEGTGGTKMFSWPLLRVALRKTILAIHPDWSKK